MAESWCVSSVNHAYYSQRVNVLSFSDILFVTFFSSLKFFYIRNCIFIRLIKSFWIHILFLLPILILVYCCYWDTIFLLIHDLCKVSIYGCSILDSITISVSQNLRVPTYALVTLNKISALYFLKHDLFLFIPYVI